MNQTSTISFPEEKAFPAFGKIPGNIIQDHKGKQEDENNKPNLRHSLLDPGTEIFSE